MYYSEKLASPISEEGIKLLYGSVPEDLISFEIYPLVDAPDGYPALGYRKVNGKYFAITLPFTIEQTEKLKKVLDRVSAIESNEVLDDATDTALLTLIANLNQRVTDLETTVNG